jgi:single-stranded-DNA-specific exonuclease
VLPPPVDGPAVAALSAALSLPPHVCQLLVARGFADPDAAKRFLRPRLEHLHAPSLMLDLDRAVERLVRAIRDGELIMVHGDYDVDGMCSTALLTRAMRGWGGRVMPFIPRRLEDGYDLSAAGVNAAIDAGARVLVTCDCGTSARKPVDALTAAGIDVIVSDHHLPGGPLPECLAVLNPKRPGCEYPDRDLAAVGVAFKLALALAAALGQSDQPVMEMLDLVALATIADVAPLRGENRVLARYGLRMLAQTRNTGLQALIRAAGLESKPLTAGRVGYILAPRLNAVGRLGHAIRGVELLLSDDVSAANRIARDLEELNRKRQDLDRGTLDRARQILARMDVDRTRGIVLSEAGWHPGVIGIVASRVVEETGRPAVLIAVSDGEGKGSGRSIPAFDLHAALGECKDLLTRYGGHRAAAGITIAADRIPAFAERFDEVAHQRLTAEDLVPELRVDLELGIADAGDNLEALLRHFEPFGIGNPGPTFLARGVGLVAAPRRVGDDGLRLQFATGDRPLEAVAWGAADKYPALRAGQSVDVVFRLERDEWNGRSRLQAKVADLRP